MERELRQIVLVIVICDDNLLILPSVFLVAYGYAGIVEYQIFRHVYLRMVYHAQVSTTTYDASNYEVSTIHGPFEQYDERHNHKPTIGEMLEYDEPTNPTNDKSDDVWMHMDELLAADVRYVIYTVCIDIKGTDICCIFDEWEFAIEFAVMVLWQYVVIYHVS